MAKRKLSWQYQRINRERISRAWRERGNDRKTDKQTRGIIKTMTPPWKLSTVTRAQTIRYIVLLISCCRHRQFKLLILMGFSFLLILEKSKLQQHLLCLERHCQANTLCVNTETNYCFNNNVLYTHVFLEFSI